MVIDCTLKPTFHYADFLVTPATNPQEIRDVPFSPNAPTSPKLPRPRGSFGKVGVMEFGHNRVGVVVPPAVPAAALPSLGLAAASSGTCRSRYIHVEYNGSRPCR